MNSTERVANGLLASIRKLTYIQFDSLSGAVTPRLYLPATDIDESRKNSKRNVFLAYLKMVGSPFFTGTDVNYSW